MLLTCLPASRCTWCFLYACLPREWTVFDLMLLISSCPSRIFQCVWFHATNREPQPQGPAVHAHDPEPAARRAGWLQGWWCLLDGFILTCALWVLSVSVFRVVLVAPSCIISIVGLTEYMQRASWGIYARVITLWSKPTFNICVSIEHWILKG